MTTLWTTPRTWVTREPITKTKLNAMSNQMSYLYAPSKALATVRGTGSDATNVAGAGTFSVIDAALLDVSLELTGRAFFVEFSCIAHNATLGTFNGFDVLVDGTTYLSSLTASPLTNGLMRFRQAVATYETPVHFRIEVPGDAFAAGVHTFSPRFTAYSGTMTVRLSTGYFAQFSVGEVG